MKTLKKLTALILALIFCLSLTACGGSKLTVKNIVDYVSDHMVKWAEDEEAGEVTDCSNGGNIIYEYAYGTARFSIAKDNDGTIRQISGSVRLQDLGVSASYEDSLSYMLYIAAVPGSYVYPGKDIDEMTGAVLNSDNYYEEGAMMVMYCEVKGWEYAYYVDEGDEYVIFEATRID